MTQLQITWGVVTTAGEPPPRYEPAAVWTGTEMIVWGGGFNLTTGGRYNPVTDTWRPVSNVGVPSLPSGSNSAVWSGAELILWGGRIGNTGTNTGGRYTP